MYKKYWADIHSNIHHEQIDQLPVWLEQAKQLMDFWPIAYYPFYMRKLENGFAVEDIYDEDIYSKDWEYIRDICTQSNAEGFPMFMGYEWQGNGQDGDHNVYFLNNDAIQKHPMTYAELVEEYKNTDAIGIGHHVAYQLGSRGKNWQTHNEKFTPFVEIYSSHGSSENDFGPVGMNRHIHMGPRVSNTSYEKGLDKGYKIGCICSGDNHNIPGVYGYGMMCALAESNSKKNIWDALINSRVYGVSASKIQLDYEIEGLPMGSTVKTDKSAVDMKIAVKGTDRIDRIEVLKNNELLKMIVPIRKNCDKQTVRFKFKLELGWGPDIRIFKDLTYKNWHGLLKIKDGTIIDVEKCWSNYGQKIVRRDDYECEFDLTTYQSTSTGKWMGNCVVANEGFIFEIEANRNSLIEFCIDDRVYRLSVEDILNDSHLFADKQKADELIAERYGKIEHYRDDPWWHNSYKVKVYQGSLSEDYSVEINEKVDIDENCQIRLRVHQRNGDMAYSSPIYIERK